MAELKIDLEKTISCAVNIRNIRTKLEQKLSEISKAMGGIVSEYNTPNAEQLLEKYEKTSFNVTELLCAIEEYSQFLENATDIYAEVERKIAEQVLSTTVDMITNAVDGALGSVTNADASHIKTTSETTAIMLENAIKQMDKWM